MPRFRATATVSAIYDTSAGDAPFTDPADNLALVDLHSSFDYYAAAAGFPVNVTKTLAAQAADAGTQVAGQGDPFNYIVYNTVTQNDYALVAHGQTSIPNFMVSVNGVEYPAGCPVQVGGSGSRRSISFWANSTNILVRDNSRPGPSGLPAITLTFTVAVFRPPGAVAGAPGFIASASRARLGFGNIDSAEITLREAGPGETSFTLPVDETMQLGAGRPRFALGNGSVFDIGPTIGVDSFSGNFFSVPAKAVTWSANDNAASKLLLTGSEITLETSTGATVFDSDLKTFGLVPSAKLTVTGQTVDFPTPTMSVNWSWTGSKHTAPTAPFTQYVVETFRFFKQVASGDWGPQLARPGVYDFDLPDIVLGTVPAETDYVDVKAVINRTLNPNTAFASSGPGSGLFGDPLTPVVATGVTARLRGGSCLLEEKAPISRGFAIVLVPNANPTLPKNVVLRRYQSIADDTTPGNGLTTNLNVSLLAWATNSETDNTQTYQYNVGSAFYVAQLAATTGVNFRSTYSMDFEITPGFVKVPATLLAPSVPSAIRLGWWKAFSASPGSVGPFSASMNFGIPQSTRHVLVLISGALISTTASGVTAVSVGGIAATKVSETAFNSDLASVWIAAVPTGSSGTVSVTFATAANAVVVSAYALYNLASYAANATTVLTGTGSTSLGTLPGGFAFVAAANISNLVGNNLMSGVGHYGLVVNGSLTAEQGYQETTGASLTLSMGTLSGANIGLAAASFG